MEINKIYNDDCLEGMKRIPDNTVNLVITDPPYCIGTTSNGKKGSWNDNNIIKPFFDAYFKELKRVCKSEAELYIIPIGELIHFFILLYRNISMSKI